MEASYLRKSLSNETNKSVCGLQTWLFLSQRGKFGKEGVSVTISVPSVSFLWGQARRYTLAAFNGSLTGPFSLTKHPTRLCM